MKAALLLFCIWLCFSFTLFAQNNAKFHHIIDQDRIERYGFILIRQIDKIKDTMVINKAQGFENRKFKVVINLENKRPVLDIWSIETLQDSKPVWWQLPKLKKINFNNPSIDEFGNQINSESNIINAGTQFEDATFYLYDARKRLGDPTLVFKAPFTAWTWSVGTTPLRYRFKADSSESTLSSTLSVSLSFGKTWGRTKLTSRAARNRSIILAPFVGLGSADIKKATVAEPRNWEKHKYTDRTNLAISFGGSVTGAINNLGIVLSLGCDKAVGPYSRRWSYDLKPWVGLGINTGLGIFR